MVVNPLSDTFFRQHRSNSWSDSLDDMKAASAIQETYCDENLTSSSASKGNFRGVILDPTNFESKNNKL